MTLNKKTRRRYLRRLLILLSGFLMLSGLLTQPRWIFSLTARYFPGAIYAVDVASSANKTTKIVALTVDDGPSAATEDILEVLNRYGVKATFFNISSYLPGHEQTVRSALLNGHELGNHLTADEASIQLSPKAFEEKLLAAEGALLPLLPDGQKNLKWMRPGMGFYNKGMVDTIEKHGYQLVLGSRFPYDTHIHSSGFASAFILNTVRSGDIIVLHDGDDGRGDRTTQTLETILPALQKKGYTITTVSNLLNSQ